jgi:ribosomal protein S27AE
MAHGEIKYCFDCADFPCARLTHLDKRYRTRYATSPIENLIRIKTSGIMSFVKSENEKWACPKCGAMLSMHKPQCLSCGYTWHK